MAELFAGVVGGVWAGGTAGAAVPPAGSAFADLAAAYAAAADGDVIRVPPGTHALPASVAKAVRFAGYDPGQTFLGQPPGGSTVSARPVRFDAVALAAPVVVAAGGGAAFLGCVGGSGLARVRNGAAAVAAGCDGRLLPDLGAAWGEYPKARTLPGGRAGRPAADYRTPATLEAPAKRRNPDGQPVTAADDWLPAADLRVRLEEAVAREAALARVIAAEATGRLFCRGGVPAHPEMRVRLAGGRLLYVKGVAGSPPPANEYEVMYAERYG